jgi:hypothetical protein
MKEAVVEGCLPAPQSGDLCAAEPGEAAEAVDDLLERRLPDAGDRLVLLLERLGPCGQVLELDDCGRSSSTLRPADRSAICSSSGSSLTRELSANFATGSLLPGKERLDQRRNRSHDSLLSWRGGASGLRLSQLLPGFPCRRNRCSIH